MLPVFIETKEPISVSEYLSSSNVQLGASYPISQQSTSLFTAGKDAVANYVNATSDEVGELRIDAC
jgi:selenocysteine lyase/cysteine desulfurase